MALRNLTNVRTSSQEVSTEQIKGDETLIAYLQMTSAGLKSLIEDSFPAKTTAWGQIDENSMAYLGLGKPDEGQPTLFLKAYDNTAEGKFSTCDFSLYFSYLDTDRKVKQLPIAKLRHVEDDRAEFRGDAKGTTYQMYSQIELREETIDEETWLALVGIA
jgi:hypothetical protein